MNLRDFMHFNEITGIQLAERAGINLQTLYGIMKGRNARYFDICKVLAATRGAVEIWEILPEEMLKEIDELKQALHEKDNPGKLKLPTNEELLEKAQRARWGSKFTGMCC